MAGVVQEHNLEKQIGCMAGFFQIFDRPQIPAGKRLYSPKRLPPSAVIDACSETDESPAVSREFERPQLKSPAKESQPKSAVPVSVFEVKEGSKASRKFCKESPRLSLDSRATFDAKGSLKPKEIPTNAAIFSINGEETGDSEKQRRAPSVIARLMGLEKLPEREAGPSKTPELRRSASESRASRDIHQRHFIDGVDFQLQQSQLQNLNYSISNNVIIDGLLRDQTANCRVYNSARNAKAEPASSSHRGIGQRKSFFDAADFFPEPKQAVSLYVEIEKRLKMRGIEEPSKDLETLKQILEAVQLKGLLHSNKPLKLNQTNQKNFMCGRAAPLKRQGRYNYDPIAGDTFPRRDRPEVEVNVRNQNRGGSSSGVKSPIRRRPLTAEMQRRANSDSMEQRKLSPVRSPKVSSSRNIPDRSPRNGKTTAGVHHKEENVSVQAEDESTSISDSVSTSSHTDTERSKLEEYKEGKHLLERCDKLLNSIAEMTSTELQPSPVSVLDSSFYKEESSPSPVMKRRVDFNFKDELAELEDDIWSASISPIQLKSEENSDDYDYMYIAEVIRASKYCPEDSDVFLLLENQQYLKGRGTSKGSTLDRKLVFDTIKEILNRKRQLPPWKVVLEESKSPLQQIWSEFKRIRERETSDDILEVIGIVLKKDLAGDAMNGWGDNPIEKSESVLDIERLIFKDLIGETIRDLAAASHQPFWPRRKLVF